jgi:hypothetical protein
LRAVWLFPSAGDPIRDKAKYLVNDRIAGHPLAWHRL